MTNEQFHKDDPAEVNEIEIDLSKVTDMSMNLNLVEGKEEYVVKMNGVFGPWLVVESYERFFQILFAAQQYRQIEAIKARKEAADND